MTEGLSPLTHREPRWGDCADRADEHEQARVCSEQPGRPRAVTAWVQRSPDAGERPAWVHGMARDTQPRAPGGWVPSAPVLCLGLPLPCLPTWLTKQTKLH